MTFQSWLRLQRERDDRIGDLARDYIANCHREGRRVFRSAQLYEALAIDARLTLNEALLEYALIYL